MPTTLGFVRICEICHQPLFQSIDSTQDRWMARESVNNSQESHLIHGHLGTMRALWPRYVEKWTKREGIEGEQDN